MRLARCLAALAVAFAAPLAMAQAYPAKPIRLIVPFPPGGGTDIFARVVSAKITETQKWNFVVDNRAGAGGNIGVDTAAKAAPDGYTMVIGQTSNLTISPALHSKLPYDPIRDLAPVALIGSGPVALVVRADSPLKSLKDLLDLAKAKPGSVTFASPGNGTVAHLAGVRLQQAAGVKFEHIPYKGAAGAIPDLLGGNVDIFMSSVPTVASHVASGKMRALAVTSLKRSPVLPDAPPIADTFPGFDSVTWFGFLMPAGTPADLVAKMNEAVNAALKSPDVRAKLAGEGGEVIGGSSAEFSAFIKKELASWAPVVKASGAKVD